MSQNDSIRTSDQAPGALIAALAAILVIVTAGVFSPGLSGDFVYDDFLLVPEAPATQSIEAAIEHWMDPYWEFNEAQSETQRGLWRPMASLALALGRLAGGGDPFGFHLVSLLLHVLATLACYRLAARLLARRLLSPTRVEGTAALVALMFAVHPAQVEAVSWISAVNDPLWGLFGLLALYRYDVAAENAAPPLLGSLFFFIALMCKEQAVVILPIALLLDVSDKRMPGFVPFIVMLAPLMTWYGLRVLVFENTDAGIFRPHGEFEMTAARDVLFRVELLGGFIGRTLLPIDDATFRPVRGEIPEGSPDLVIAAGWTAIALIALVALWARGRRTAGFGILVLLLVVAPIVAAPDRAGLFPLSDRYLYIGVFGASLAVTSFLATLPTLLPLLTLAMLAPSALATITWNDQSRFENELVFRFKGVEDAPRNPYTRWGAGKAYLEEYQRTLDIDNLHTAMLHYLHSFKGGTTYGDGSFVDDTSLPMEERIRRLENLIMETPPAERRPDPTVLWTPTDRLQATLGYIACKAASAEAERNPDFTFALEYALQTKRQLWPEEPALDTVIAQIQKRIGDYEGAKESLGFALQRAPSNVTNYALLADILMKEGDLEGARTTLQRAIEIDTDDVDIRITLARVALDSRRFDLAERELETVLTMTGRKDVRALVLRGELDQRRELPSDAMRWIDQALAIDPDNGEAHKLRGLVAAMMGDVDGAIDGFARACELRPEDFEAHYNFAVLMLQQQPAADAPPEELRAWEDVVVDALVRAYVLSPRTGEEQLLLQRQIEPFLRGSPDKAFSLATVLLEQGRDVLALYWLQRTVEWRDRWTPAERAANLADAFTTSGRIYLKAGSGDDALDAFRSGVLSDPNHFGARFELGLLLSERGEYAAALPHLEKALELFPDAGVATEMQDAVRGTIEKRLADARAADEAGPPPPTADTPDDAPAPDGSDG